MLMDCESSSKLLVALPSKCFEKLRTQFCKRYRLTVIEKSGALVNVSAFWPELPDGRNSHGTLIRKPELWGGDFVDSLATGDLALLSSPISHLSNFSGPKRKKLGPVKEFLGL